MNLNEIKAGTILVSNSQWGPSFCQVAEFETNRWGEQLNCIQDGKFIAVHNVGNADMLGIGWKIATESEIARMLRYREVA